MLGCCIGKPEQVTVSCTVDAGCPAGHVVNPLYITARRGAATFLPLLEYFDKHVWPLRMLKLPLCDPLFEHAKPEIDRSEGEGSHHIVSHGTTALMEGNTADFKSDKDLWPLPKPIALFIEALYAYTGRKCVVSGTCIAIIIRHGVWISGWYIIF